MARLGRAVRDGAWTAAAVLLVSACFLAAGCRDRSANTLRVVVSQRDDVPPVVRVVVTVSTTRDMASASTASAAGALALPVTVALSVAGLPRGDAMVEATAFDAAQSMVARGTATISLPAASAVTVELRCQTLGCAVAGPDGGVDGAPDGAATPDSSPEGDGAVRVGSACGNGRLDFGETCDTALTAELPGACPASCDDGIACTRDTRIGDACGVRCDHAEITATLPGDGCCPANSDHSADLDCSASCGNGLIDPGESCDSMLGPGPGTCPAGGDCDDGDACTEDTLVSAGTCSARCTHRLIITAVAGDGCCPLRADAITDEDCHASCGNGVVEPGERCDAQIAAGRDGACPTAADCDDGNPCTVDAVLGSGCQVTCSHRIIDGPAPGDGCCPAAGLGRNVDSDCPAVCGNGVVEAGETCDMAVASPAMGSCPTSCPASTTACIRFVMHGAASSCSAACVPTPTAVCAPLADGCCPTGCTRMTDPDCSATCGNGKIDPGEACDIAISTGVGACPRSCADGIPCTDDLLVDADTCNSRCLFVATTTLRNGDGCCPPGAHAGIDADCPATCGNGVVETPWESCDSRSVPSSCPATCLPTDGCTLWTRTATAGCDVRCARQSITACASGDGCCPAGCNAGNDSDCAPRCGNGVLERTETCDRGITAGHAGACPTSCADGDPCTEDIAHGSAESCSRTCSHVKVTACGGGDRCCPAGCTTATDADCRASCPNGIVEAGETCDPGSTCPTGCASDGDACTVDQLVGSPDTCNAACAHVPILRCSGTQRDGCCPTECSAASDSDC
jgi:hypothetical protein